MTNLKDQGAVYAIIGAYLWVHVLLFRRLLTVEPFAGAEVALLLNTVPGLLLIATGAALARGRLSPGRLAGISVIVLVVGLLLAAWLLPLAPSVAYVWRLRGLARSGILLALWLVPPALLLASGVLGLRAAALLEAARGGGRTDVG